MSYLQKQSKQDFTIFDLQSSKPSPKVHRKSKTFYFYFAISYGCICLVRNWGKREGKKGFWILGKNEKSYGTTVKICKNLNSRRLRPSQFRKLYQSSSREGVEEEEEEDERTVSPPCYLAIQKTCWAVFFSSFLFHWFFSFFFFWPLIFRIKY